MNKTFFIILASSLLLYTLYTYHRFVPLLVTYYLPTLNSNNSSIDVLLADLSTAPVFGHFFVEEAIYHSAIEKNWDKVLDLASSAVSTPINENRFTIWYHKALAECLLKQY